nr:hypothetical protein YKEOBPQY_YKEOBPQY_CDS_0009 [Microvirus sp.]
MKGKRYEFLRPRIYYAFNHFLRQLRRRYCFCYKGCFGFKDGF